MGSTTTQTTICNRALQLLGVQSISSLQENSRGARAMNRAYQPVLLNLLRLNYWSFSIKRASLPTDADVPAFGRSNYYTLPPDYLDLAPPDAIFGITGGGSIAGNQIIAGTPIITGSPILDWQIEGGRIATNQKPPLNLRYVSSAVTESQFDACFVEALAYRLAMDTCEEVTQSNTKLQNLAAGFDSVMELAKQRNAFEGRPVQAPTDTFVVARF